MRDSGETNRPAGRGRVLAPDLRRPAASQDGGGRVMILALILLILVTGGGALVQVYRAPSGEPPLIEAESAPYKVAAAAQPAVASDRPLYDLVEAPQQRGPIDLRPQEQSAEAPPAPEPAAPSPSAQSATDDGRWLAQIAALRSEASAREAWERLKGRDPALFQNVRLDLQRADLGAKGVYYRLRAGYFPTREAGGIFCARVRALSQECIVVGE